MKIIFSGHAIFEIEFRKIIKQDIEHLIEHPMQKISAKKIRIIIQGKYYDHIENKEMLLRVIGEESEKEFHVVTVYKTSNIDKYWNEDFK